MTTMFKPCPTPALRLASLALGVAVACQLGGCASKPQNIDDGKSIAKLYEEAREESSSGANDRAIKLYERIEGRAAGTLLSQQAQLEQAYLLYKQSEKARALAVVDRFLKLHPTSPAGDYAHYLQGLINFNDDLGLFGTLAKQDLSERDQQASRDAYQSFKQLVDRYPQSKYAPDAQVRMKYIVNALASYEVHVARYYYMRGAYLASANRAQQALQDFRGVPAAEEALFLMAASYDKLGLVPLRDDAQRVLKTNYPRSQWIGRGYDEKTNWWRLW